MSMISEHFDQIARDYDYYKKRNWYYYSNLKKLYKTLIPSGSRVLDIGCGTGDILIELDAAYGLGIDVSPEMINLAKSKYKDKNSLEFISGTVEEHGSFLLSRRFDHIFLSDVIEHLEYPQKTINALSQVLHPGAILIISMANPLWEPVLLLAEKLKLKMPEGPHYRISSKKLESFLLDNKLVIIQKGHRLILPVHIPFISDFFNRVFEAVPIFNRMGLIMFWVCTKDGN
ncbi:MAG: class I SAM-dependent methyltransferase [Nitrospirae bacterium]|nr:class I SAM-dependent methyltransferase [Nitrospirota bacterium]